MALQSIWFHTELPEDVVEIVEKDFEKFKVERNLEESRIGGNGLDEDIRKARNTWIPTTHWIAGFVWHYVCLLYTSPSPRDATLSRMPSSA